MGYRKSVGAAPRIAVMQFFAIEYLFYFLVFWNIRVVGCPTLGLSDAETGVSRGSLAHQLVKAMP